MDVHSCNCEALSPKRIHLLFSYLEERFMHSLFLSMLQNLISWSPGVLHARDVLNTETFWRWVYQCPASRQNILFFKRLLNLSRRLYSNGLDEVVSYKIYFRVNGWNTPSGTPWAWYDIVSMLRWNFAQTHLYSTERGASRGQGTFSSHPLPMWVFIE